MIELTNSKFYHFNRSGGHWTHDLLLNACESIKTIHSGHYAEEHFPKGNKLAFTFIRHPISWYESTYLKERHNNFPRIYDPLSLHAHLPFEKFIETVTSLYPGHLFNKVEKWCKNMDFVGRLEKINYDLIEVLTLAKEVFDSDIIFSYPKSNTQHYATLHTPYTRKLIKLSERDFLEKYYPV